MEQSLTNSKHVTTSLEGTTTTTKATMTATQMRATLIYLAPFLQPCKNVVTTNTPITKTRAQSMLQQHSLDNEHEDMTKITTATTKSSTSTSVVLQQQQTHVPRSRLNSNRNNHNNAINSNSTIIINNNNSNNNNKNTSSSRPCCSNNMNPYDMTCNQEECICDVRTTSKCSSCCSNTTSTTTATKSSSSCCHNNCMQHEKFVANFEYQEEEKQVKEQNLQQKDKFNKNYEMPALETTTTTTTTVFSSSNNKLRQKQLKEDKPSSTATSLLSTSSSSTLNLSSTSFVNYTNNRSTKYLRERGRRNILQQQEQTLKQKTHGSILKKQQPPLQLEALMMQHNASYDVKDEDEQVEDTNTDTDIEKQRNLTCGRGPCHKLAKGHPEKQQDTTNIKSNNTSVLSRCHFYNQHNKYNNNSNTIMLSNVQDIMMPQQLQQPLKNMNTFMSHTINCDDHQLEYAQNNNVMEEVKEDVNEETSTYEAGVLKENINLRLTKNSQNQEEEVEKQHEELKNSYINYKEILFNTNPNSTQSSSTFSSTNPHYHHYNDHHLTSYTTILKNKECRCFKHNNYNKRDKIGSECNNLERKNFKLLPGIVGATTQFSDNYCMINKNQHITSSANTSSSTICGNLYELLNLGIKLQTLVGQGSNLYKTVAVSKWLFMWLLFLMLSTSAHCWAGRNDVPTNCTFPARWEGSWFLSGYQQSIHIKGSQFSYRGRCAASDGNKYLIVDEKGCHRCLVIYEKHNNVLQYKENFCKGRETLQNLCDQIPGDALLYSLFRESAEPVKCPLKGPFVFTYNRGNGECKSPVSNIESCTEDSRLLLSFQACPDVVGTESTVEELTCLATWKDGNSRYLVGLVSHHHAISNEERYRCFVYEKISSLMGHFPGSSMSSSKDAEYKLAQSGDATCNGLDSAEVGSRIMSLRKPPVTERCDFPVWFKGPRHWHVLMGNVYKYHNDGSIHIIKPNGYMETRALCEQINKQTATEMMSVVHYTTGCQSGFMCMVFYRRDTHVIEIQTGKPASRLEDACAPDHFDINKTPYITLLASNPDPQICPMEGLYTLRGAIGPPYLATRHKRNHNKVHGLHSHHHQYEGNGGREYLHKRHSSLSFRNSQHDEKNAWHSNTRGLPVRSRREASSTVTPLATVNSSSEGQGSQTTQEILVVGNNTNVGFVKGSEDAESRLRNRRNVPECVTNFKAQRQLWIGCTEENVIDVRPMCNDEGDEEYSCYGSWSENGTIYIIARHKGTKHGVCISYRPTEGTSAKLVVGDACYRGTQKPPEHHLVANLSVFGKCGETGSTSSSMPIISWLNLLMVTVLITILSQLPIQR